MMISLRDIEVRFGDFTALHGISLDVNRGEFFTLLGSSGCGKTTTLRTITGFVKPLAGTVHVAGRDITNLEIEKRNIGMMFQSYALFPTMSVFENIAFGLRVKKLSKKDIKEKVNEIARKVELEPFQLTRKISELSGGQQQRVAFARALVTTPSIICLDEPLSNLDAKLRIQLRNELKGLQRRFGITTIYVTHDQEEALTLSDRIAVFNNGTIEQIGSPNEVYSHSSTEYVCNFIGDINKLSKDFLEGIGASLAKGVDTTKNCYIRLERLFVNTENDGHLSFNAVVENFEFYGLYIKYTLNAKGEYLKVIEKNSSIPLYKVGDSVKTSFNPSDVMQY